jgi:predicted lipoprotein with Yx(FWY)xxD motif
MDGSRPTFREVAKLASGRVSVAGASLCMTPTAIYQERLEMRTTRMLLSGALAAALVPAAVASAQSSAGAASAKTITLRHTRLGSILTAPNGFTLYEFTHDRLKSDSCQHISECTSFWPPLTTSGTPKAGKGVKANLLGTIKLKNGSRQVTYNGHALYEYTGDTGPAQTSYIGVNAFGGHWYGLNASGKAVK